MLSDLWNLGGRRLLPKRRWESRVISIQVTSRALDTCCSQLWFLAFGWVHTISPAGNHGHASFSLLESTEPLPFSPFKFWGRRKTETTTQLPLLSHPSQITPFLSPFLIFLFAGSVVSMALRHCCLVVPCHSLLCVLPHLLHGLLIACPVLSPCGFSQWN